MPERTVTPRKPTRQEVAAAEGATTTDILARGLRVVFCGINPSLYSAAVGHHFARPGNRFWPAVHRAGFTDRRLSPFEDRRLLEYGCGLTNIADRATATADQVTADELAAGARSLRRKLRAYAPRAVAFLGVGAYRTAFGKPRATFGRQPDALAGVEVWVLPNPSRLNATFHHTGPPLFIELRKAVEREGNRSPR